MPTQSQNPSPSGPSPHPPSSLQDPDSKVLSRSQSIQFSTPKPPVSRSISPTNRSLDQHHNESSADEITPIVSRERGGAKNKTYDATSISHSAAGSRQNSASSTRRRKAAPVSPAARGQNGSGGEEGKIERGFGWRWWKDIAEKYGSVELDNKGSVARDHLALERTFLAWLRTSLAFASIGIAVTQLFRLNTTISKREGLTPAPPDNSYHLRQVGKPLGATFLGIAILVLLVGGRRYFESQVCFLAKLVESSLSDLEGTVLGLSQDANSIGSYGVNFRLAGAVFSSSPLWLLH